MRPELYRPTWPERIRPRERYNATILLGRNGLRVAISRFMAVVVRPKVWVRNKILRNESSICLFFLSVYYLIKMASLFSIRYQSYTLPVNHLRAAHCSSLQFMSIWTNSGFCHVLASCLFVPVRYGCMRRCSQSCVVRLLLWQCLAWELVFVGCANLLKLDAWI